MIGTIIRVLFGFAIACLLAGLTKVLFAWSPAELAGMPGDPMEKLALSFPVGTHMAIFSAPFALIAIAMAEWRGWRDWAYYAAVGIIIALIGFLAQYQAEMPAQSWSVTSSTYPIIAYLTSGFVGGLVYWMFSGRLVEPAHTSTAAHRHTA